MRIMNKTSFIHICLLTALYSSVSFAQAPLTATDFFQEGIQLKNKKDYVGAVRAFSASIELAPLPASYYNRALVKSSLNDLQGAVTDLDQAIDSNPQYTDAYLQRGIN